MHRHINAKRCHSWTLLWLLLFAIVEDGTWQFCSWIENVLKKRCFQKKHISFKSSNMPAFKMWLSGHGAILAECPSLMLLRTLIYIQTSVGIRLTIWESITLVHLSHGYSKSDTCTHTFTFYVICTFVINGRMTRAQVTLTCSEKYFMLLFKVKVLCEFQLKFLDLTHDKCDDTLTGDSLR